MSNKFEEVQFILYVSDQFRSRDFYKKVFQIEPSLDVPGMSEFQLNEKCKLGLMPENGIAKILSGKVPHPNSANGIPRCELYLNVENAEEYFERAIRAGAKEVSPILKRDWGDLAGYVCDLDGHIIAFAGRLDN
ncbi:MAG: VOC family protein [Ignavibacteria bacterium]